MWAERLTNGEKDSKTKDEITTSSHLVAMKYLQKIINDMNGKYITPMSSVGYHLDVSKKSC